MLVKEIMLKEFHTLHMSDTLRTACTAIDWQKGYGAPIVDDDHYLRGIFTRPHLIGAFMRNCDLDTPITALMRSSSVVTLHPEDDFNHTIKVFVETNYSYYPVIDSNNRLVGIVLATDVLRLGAHEAYKLVGSSWLDYPNNAFFGIDAKGYIRSVSKTASEVLDANVNDIIGKHVLETIPMMENLAKDLLTDARKSSELSRQLSIAQKRIEYYQNQLENLRDTKYTFSNIIGMSPQMKRLRSMAAKAARTSSTVLIRGESGTGKELIAHAIHNASPRCNKPFIKVNCAAIPEQLIESELFGYCEGAFTGAVKGGKPGKFELANGGSIFLDEIGDLAPSIQAKLLRVLQEFEFERLGGTKTVNVDVRVIAATNRNLNELIQRGNFREDLFYRLNVVQITTPPLRDRKEDIDYLTDYLIESICERLNLYNVTISDRARELLKEYDFPGNVRELENILERAINFVDDDSQMIDVEHLLFVNQAMASNEKKNKPDMDVNLPYYSLKEALAVTEKKIITEALKKSCGNKIKAANILGIHRSLLYKKMNKYNIT